MAQQLSNSLAILRLKQVKQRTSLSRSSIYAAIKSGIFPRQISLTGARSVGWVEAEVEAFILARIEASRATRSAK